MAFVGGLTLGKGVAVRQTSSFAGARVPAMRRVVRPARPAQASTVRMGFEISDGEEYDSNPVVVLLAIAGWIIPSSVPVNIPLLKGTGLTQAFLASINDNLSRWPKGPALDDPFWVLLFIWHLGMFATLIFGSIGYNGNKQKRFN